MTEYTPGALGALFHNSSSNDKSVKKAKSSATLSELFKKKSKPKDVSKKVVVHEMRNSKPVIEKTEASSKTQPLKETHEIVNVSNSKIVGKNFSANKDIESFNIIGPTVIPSNDNTYSAAKLSKKGKRKRNTEDATDTDEFPGESKYTGPSRKFQVIEEDKKKPLLDLEKESRTIFVGNLPSSVTGKILKRKFKAYGEVETVRLRSIARPDMKTTKKLAAIKKTFHENRNNVNAYVRFKDLKSAQNSCQLNGTEIDSHVIRVDIAGNGKSETKDNNVSQQHDQSKAVFLGNVKFSEKEDTIRIHFEKCGAITDVRLVRDTATGMGKGFGYVNFSSSDSVEKAIQMNGSLLNERAIRVSRAVNRPKQTLTLTEKKNKLGPFKPKAENSLKFKKSFSKISKKTQKNLTEQSYQGTQIQNKKERQKNSKRKLNRNEKRNSIISKKLSLPKKKNSAKPS